MNTQLTPGVNYRLTIDQYPFNGKTEIIERVFIKDFACYDARFHGAAKPADYHAYQFRFNNEHPEHGVKTLYAYQIHSAEAI